MKNLETFPYVFLNCSNESDFYNRYFQAIFPVLIRSGKIQDANNFCDNLEIPFEQAFEQCCSSIVPWTLADEKILKLLQENQRGFEKIGNLANIIKDNLRKIIIGTGKHFSLEKVITYISQFGVRLEISEGFSSISDVKKIYTLTSYSVLSYKFYLVCPLDAKTEKVPVVNKTYNLK